MPHQDAPPELIAVVPVKALGIAKQRLSSVLDAGRRRCLVLTMLTDVLDTLARVAKVEHVLVVTRDPDVAVCATRLGATVVREVEGADMNASIAFGLEQARLLGASAALVLPADVPLATAQEISDVIDEGIGDETIVLAPSADGDGTNALLVPLHVPFKPAYGPGSYERHRISGAAIGLDVATLQTLGLARDIDTPADLAALSSLPGYAFLDPATGGKLSVDDAHALVTADLADMMRRAEAMTVAAHGTVVTYSKKVFIPLTKLCRDVCHYCTFAHAPRELKSAYLSPDDVLAIARAGKAAGCKEALFTLGDKPELRYAAAREALAELGYDFTLSYLEAMAALVLKETGLLPHLNPGVMDETWLTRLKAVSISQGIMLELSAPRLSEKGGPHFGSPDKDPAVRLDTLEAAGRAGVPFTTGILIGIGETRAERIDALLKIRELHLRHGHIQEVIVQNFRAKPDTRMANAPEPSLDDHLWTIAAARLILGASMNIQAPPNLQDADALSRLVRAGINDWGGVSPVTPDHVNPERPWPHLDHLAEFTRAAGRTLAERTALYPAYALAALALPPLKSEASASKPLSHVSTTASQSTPPHPTGAEAASPPPLEGREGQAETFRVSSAIISTSTSPFTLDGRRAGDGGGVPPDGIGAHRPDWIAKSLKTPLLHMLDAIGFAREDDWAPGDATIDPPVRDAALIHNRRPARSSPVAAILERAVRGVTPGEPEIVELFAARGDDFSAVCKAADDMRQMRNGDAVTYVVNRNINYTNICTYGCKFCAFSKGRLSTDHRDKPYNLELEEVAERTREAWARGATEVCLQGGIAPRYTGATYLAIAEAVKIGAPDIHVHAFSPLEVWHGATTLKLPLPEYLARLKAAGLSSLPGTAAEILDDEVRQVLCPDKINTEQWLEVMEAAHGVGLKSTATIMFGHIDHPRHWARHLLRVRALQEKTGGFTELVPLAFVHMESPIFLRGQSRKGPTFREAVLMHAVSRLVLDPLITNIQASWVKMGPEGAALCLASGANDVGGTLMNESITRAAGAAFGQEMTPTALEQIIRDAGRTPRQRGTFYGAPSPERTAVSYTAAAE